ncbi:MAG: cytochrome C oxidase subunit IV family protein [Flavisolibacter sp.]|jgi:cytochrome c oxidase subunit IV|nr:cytochrome C oxidase subunit IV family protein [Flavisolibacter sp.]
MEHNTHSTEAAPHADDKAVVKRIWRTFWILLIITIIELLMGLSMYAVEMPGWVVLFLKGVICILTLAKAFYIVAVFMHLGDEIRNMIMTIVVPLFLFVWFITAFLWDGNSFRTMRNKYDKFKLEKTMPKDQKTSDSARHGFGG